MWQITAIVDLQICDLCTTESFLFNKMNSILVQLSIKKQLMNFYKVNIIIINILLPTLNKVRTYVATG